MNKNVIISGLDHPSPCFLCSQIGSGDRTPRYRVPLVHRPLAFFYSDALDLASGRLAIADLPSGSSGDQLRALVEDGHGLGIWVARARCTHPNAPTQAEPQDASGAVIVFPPHEWEMVRDEFRPWLEIDDIFEGLPYSFDDILPFAGVNFSPDVWYLVKRGPMAGKVCWWTHDGDSVIDEAWADDIRAWGDRLFTEAPEVLGGIIRYGAADSVDDAPEGAELFPEQYLPG